MKTPDLPSTPESSDHLKPQPDYKDTGMYIFREPVIYVAILLSASVAWFAPLDVLDRLFWLKPATSFLESHFPAMAAYVRKSAFPQVTALYFLLMAVHAPFHIPGIYRDHLKRLPAHRAHWRGHTPAKKAGALLVAALMFPGMGAFFLFFNPGYDLPWMPINSERWALGIFGWFFAGAGGVLMTTTGALWAWGILSGDFGRRSTARDEEEPTSPTMSN